jgi:hypothetical protein
MECLQQRIDTVATWFLGQGLSVIPIGADKRPVVPWGEYMEKPLKEWRFRGCNIALLTGQFNNLVVADCDSEESYIGWLKTKQMTPLRVRTKRGMQFYYRHPGEYIKSGSHLKDKSGFTYDIKGDKGYVVAPPSVRSGHQYQFLPCSQNIRGKYMPFSQLPMFDPTWRPEQSLHYPERSATVTAGIRNGIAYINRIFAVAGEHGDKRTFMAACKLIESGMDEASALSAMIDWNQTNAKPPWPKGRLLHYVRSAKALAR